MKVPGQLLLEGEVWDKERLRAAVAQASGDELSFWAFVGEWLDGSDTVTAHTSGSTGTPKPVRIRKEQMLASAKNTGRRFGLEAGQRALLCLPCHYIAGKMMVVRAFALGLDLWRASPSAPWEGWDKPVSFAAMVPAQVAKTLREAPAQLDAIAQLIIGGGAIPKGLREALAGRPTQSFATYGMTETVTHVAVKELKAAEAAPYEALPGVRLRLDERGCLVIHAPAVADAPVVTNDLVELLPGNRFHWLGRWDNVINSGGVKLHPEVLEAKLESLSPHRFFVAGRPHPHWGEQAVLVLECPEIAPEERQRLEQEIRRRLHKWECPKEIFCVPEFVETPSGKVRRKATLAVLFPKE